jgi:HK97 gp10 family phage protein
MFSMRVEGGEDLARELNKLSVRLDRRLLTEALMEGGQPMRDAIAHAAPREPGAPDLADNINIAPVRKQAGDSERTANVGIGVPKKFFYDWFQEFGTVRMQGKSYYRPGFDGKVPETLGIISRALWLSLAGRGVSQPSMSVPSLPFSDGRLL